MPDADQPLIIDFGFPVKKASLDSQLEKIALVGAEDAVIFRVRRAVFAAVMCSTNNAYSSMDPKAKLSWTHKSWRAEDHAGVQGLGNGGAASVDQGTQVHEQAFRVRRAGGGDKMI